VATLNEKIGSDITAAMKAKDIGKVMKAVMPKLSGKHADGRAVNEAVRRKLGA